MTSDHDEDGATGGSPSSVVSGRASAIARREQACAAATDRLRSLFLRHNFPVAVSVASSRFTQKGIEVVVGGWRSSSELSHHFSDRLQLLATVGLYATSPVRAALNLASQRWGATVVVSALEPAPAEMDPLELTESESESEGEAEAEAGAKGGKTSGWTRWWMETGFRWSGRAIWVALALVVLTWTLSFCVCSLNFRVQPLRMLGLGGSSPSWGAYCSASPGLPAGGSL